MTVCLFLSFWSDAGAGEVAKLNASISAIPGLCKALAHASSAADDPYVKDGAPPSLVVQLYFPALSDLESASGRLKALTSPAEFPTLSRADITQQAMRVHAFPVPEPRPAGCTYLVAYEGEAQDLSAWIDHYIDSHVPVMARFPGLRELEVYTRLDWDGGLPWRRVNFMQRNKVAFDSAQALTDALHSPVRHEMRKDYNAFPPFTGPVTHFAMTTRAIHLEPV